MQMLRRLGMFSLAIGLTVAACDDDDETGPPPEVYTATMNGANEAPNPVTTPTTGTATFTVTGNTIAYNVTISNWEAGQTLSGAHIHFAPAAGQQTGGVLLGFCCPPPATGTFTTSGGSGTITATNEHLAAIRAGGTYFNVHATPKAPGGIIRGNLVRQP